MEKILVSLPVYNEGRLLKRAVNSILEQTYPNFDLVIVEDCSTDNSLEEARKFLYDPRVTVIGNPTNRGCFYSKNVGLKGVETGEYDVYTTHDADDFSQPTRFEEAILAFRQDSNIMGVQDFEIRIGNPPPTWYNPPFTPMANLAHAFFRASAFKDMGYFDNTDFSGDEEYWHRLNAYCAKNGYYTNTLQKVLYYAEVTDDNMILRYDDTLRQRYREHFWQETAEMTNNNSFYKPFFEKP